MKDDSQLSMDPDFFEAYLDTPLYEKLSSSSSSSSAIPDFRPVWDAISASAPTSASCSTTCVVHESSSPVALAVYFWKKAQGESLPKYSRPQTKITCKRSLAFLLEQDAASESG